MSASIVARRRRFHEAAMAQRACAVPGCRARDFQGHHVVYAQEVRRRGGDVYDARNALRLCLFHHTQHHGRGIPVPLTSLTDANIGFAWELLGPWAYDYLRRLYAGRDTRLETRLHECI